MKNFIQWNAPEKSQSHNQEEKNLCKSDSPNLPMIWEKEPYRSLIEKKQYHECTILHLEQVNRIRKSLGGRQLSYNQCYKRLQRFLAMNKQQVGIVQ